MLIDTHAHLWFDDYAEDLDDVLSHAKAAGVEKMIVPGTDIVSSKAAIELAKKYPGVIYGAVGIHPEEVLGHNDEETPLDINSRKVRPSPLLSVRGWALPLRSDLVTAVAIGEIGTDGSTEELRNCMSEQIILFREQCEMALEFDLPIIVHTRESLTQALEVLDALPQMPKGQFHCFSHDEAGVEEVLKRGFYVSFCGNITWSKRVARLVAMVPDERLLLETDSPLMVPRDKRGKPVQLGAMNTESSDLSFASLQIAERSELREPGDRNEPANVRYLAQMVADLRGVELDHIEKITTENAIRLFRL